MFMRKILIISLMSILISACATNPEKEVIRSTSYTSTAWGECCWNDIGPVIIRTPRRTIRFNIWVNTRWGNRGW